MKNKLFSLILITLTLFSCTFNIKPTTPPSRAPQIRVLLANFSQKDSLLLKGTFTLQLEEALYVLGKHNPFFYISPSKSGFKMYNTNRLFVFNASDVIRISPANAQRDRFKFRNKWYKGKIILRTASNGSIQLINAINLEDYLKSVVAGEMPSGKEEYFEALKAQAICARTYALNKMNARKGQHFDVYGDFRDQEYGSLDKQTKLATLAVQSTRGVVLQYHDSLAQVYFHSTCGGVTESAANLWGSSRQLPYLPVRKDVLGDSFACSVSPYFRWTRRFTFSQIDSLFNKNFHHPLIKRPVNDTLTVHCAFKVNDRTLSGRVKSLTIDCPDTSVVLNNFQIRQFFSTFNAGKLPSLLFTLHSEGDSVLVIRGGGYGHGVGMCQWGALNMSMLKFKYYDILVNQYFPGTYLKRLY